MAFTAYDTPGDGLVNVSSDDTTAFIDRLPAELLSHIVEAVAELEPPRSPVSGEGRDFVRGRVLLPLWDPLVQGGSLGWIRLSHISRSWRHHICENMPLLWAQFLGCFRAPHALEEMLRRVGEDVPLSLRFGSDDYHPDEHRSPWKMIETLAAFWPDPHRAYFLSRIRALFIHDIRSNNDEPGDEGGVAFSILANLSNLEILEIHFLQLIHNDTDEDKLIGPHALIIPTPNLREVRFTNYFIPWTAPGLTHLSLALDNVGLPDRIICDVLIIIAPSIEVLALDYCLPGYCEYPPMPKSFPELRQLYLRDQDYCVDDLAQALKLTSIALSKLELILDPTRTWRHATSSAASVALTWLSPGYSFDTMSVTQAYIDNERIAPDSSEHIHLAFSRRASRLQPSCGDSYAKVDLVVGIENDGATVKDYTLRLVAMCDAVHSAITAIWDGIKFCHLDLPLWKWANTLEHLLCRLPNVHEYHIMDPIGKLDDLIHILWPIPLPGPCVGGVPTLRLETLHIVANGHWNPESIEHYCNLLNLNITGGDRYFERFHTRPPLIGLLRLNFVRQSVLAGQSDEGQLSEGDFVGLFDRREIERVTIRFL